MKENIGLLVISLSEEDIKAKFDAVMKEEEDRARQTQGQSGLDEAE